ncbi:shikimate kinase [Veillonella sp. CHU740]|uniref:shikimate kinase n=1 Tax=Veillonella sp. CHU740 TaxID=2490950 RepID=UPI000F8DD277|nr:shikimate kinase [Veillonella sp. CHU740]
MFGLLGRTLVHTYSPMIHKALGNTSYDIFEMEPDQLQDFFNRSDLQGLNITIPYKINALQACHHISDIAEAIGCVNTMVRQADGSWYGTNTDYDGFLATLDWSGIEVIHKHCLILGDGASSNTVHVALERLGAASITHISRHRFPTYEHIAQFYERAQIIINCTPVGMYPQCPDQSIRLAPFTHLEGVIDLVYNPHRTGIVLEAETLGIPHVNGLIFLLAQAIAASALFLGRTYDESILVDLYKQFRQAQENIVLIGMPGAGKSTIGEALAKLTGRTLVDIDNRITEEVGSISDYILTHGEPAFRTIEAKIISDVGKQTGLLISTGGGAVTIPENFAPLRQNGRIYEIYRPLEELDTTGRVLSSGGIERLQQLYNERAALYATFRQVQVLNNGTPETVAQCILDDLYKNLV